MTEQRNDDALDAEITELGVDDGDDIGEREAAGFLGADAIDDPHVIEDLAAGQGRSEDDDAVPVEDVMQLAGIRDPVDQTAVAASEEIDRLGSMTHVGVYEGELESRTPGSDQPDEPDAANLELLVEDELREGETADAGEAAEEGLTWIPPSDPPFVPGDDGQPVIAAGFGNSADDEPFDADHHGSPVSGQDERTERVREALVAHAETSGLVDRLRFDTIGDQVVVEGTVDDLDDEDAVLAVISDVEGVTEVVNRLEVPGAE